MGVMDKLKIFVVKEPVVAASCLIAGFGLFLPAVVRPILDSWETAEKVPPPPLNEVCDFLHFWFVLCDAFRIKQLTLFPFNFPSFPN
ncbi:fiber protein Fb11 [Panicum miliaceum]|uniref:Fiber protein Fb11 n=1 Tax=Panicum miliaceum TaxID=4540 RepID=A0A3L6T1S3_PANMI|nr:fiber protein Fb11 [Panicum miliaceum]